MSVHLFKYNLDRQCHLLDWFPAGSAQLFEKEADWSERRSVNASNHWPECCWHVTVLL